MTPRPLLSADDVAVLLGCARAHVYRLIRSGVLPAVSLGRAIRVNPTALEEFINRGGAPRITVDTRPRRAGGSRASR